MKIEIWEDVGARAQPWRYHFVNKGRITAAPEQFPTKQNAVRAAKGFITATLKHVGVKPTFELKPDKKDPDKLVLTWS